jgi:hypothetical protein
VPSTAGGATPGTTSESMSITHASPPCGSMSTFLFDRSLCASPAKCSRRTARASRVQIWSRVRNDPRSGLGHERRRLAPGEPADLLLLPVAERVAEVERLAVGGRDHAEHRVHEPVRRTKSSGTRRSPSTTPTGQQKYGSQ